MNKLVYDDDKNDDDDDDRNKNFTYFLNFYFLFICLTF